VRRFLGATGRVLITGGVLVLLFVAYQLWGTGLYEARAQNRLKDEFREQLRQSRATTTTAPSTTTGPTPTEPPPTVSTTESAPEAPVVADGDSVGIIDIPRIGLSKAIVEGVNVDDLRNGPGHYPGTPFPGQVGNAAIAGHRTTYGAPFGDLDRLSRGDEITLQTVQGTFRYTVERDPFAVDPDDSSVLDPTTDNGTMLATLTLTTCDPKYSAAQRLIVKANLVLPVGEVALPATVEPDAPQPEISGLSGESSSRTPAILWGAIAAVVGLLWWLVFHRHPRWSTWLIGAIPFVAALFVFYTYLERVLPSNY
jgi:sortase A